MGTMNTDLKKLRLDALVKGQEAEDLRKKWMALTNDDPIENDLALSEYVKSKNQHLDLIRLIREVQEK